MELRTPTPTNPAPAILARRYFNAFFAYLALMGLFWAIGLEGIYQHPTPFYALFMPVAGTMITGLLAVAVLLAGASPLLEPRPARLARVSILGFAALGVAYALWADPAGPRPFGRGLAELPWHLPTWLTAAIGLWALGRFGGHWLDTVESMDRRALRRLLGGLFGFSVLLACAVAMMRGGFQGIDQAYARAALEYVGDIGKTSGIKSLFTRYLEIHEHLSMHAKVHPPGPIALLWMMSFVVGNSPMALSIATILFGSLAIFPLFGWARRVTESRRIALLACLLYTLAPSVVLFTATSADALFAPFTLTTLYCFERAIRTRSAGFALAAGLGYGVMALLKFSLIGVGAYFGLVGLWLLRDKATRMAVIQTAALMILGAAIVLLGVYWWSSFNVIEAFHVAKTQFDTDQFHLDELAPRLPAWTYRLLNPLCWFYFAGIPLSLLALREFLSGDRDRRPVWICFGLMLVILNLLYLARGEGERSALYMIPFVAIPAAACLDRLAQGKMGIGAVHVTAGFLLFQCWFTEAFFYTYW